MLITLTKVQILMKKTAPGPIHTWLIMMKAMQAVTRFSLSPVLDEGLGDSDFRVLDVLLHKGPMPVSVIGPKVNLNAGSVSVAVDRLFKKGLVTREECSHDRRVRTVTLTEKGRKFFCPIFQQHTALIDQAFEELSNAEREKLEAMLKKVGKRAQKLLQDEGAEED
jgi:MarR family transcriptional regulator, 2-MHQ and catechol-resistance regulon repressor